MHRLQIVSFQNITFFKLRGERLETKPGQPILLNDTKTGLHAAESVAGPAE